MDKQDAFYEARSSLSEDDKAADASFSVIAKPDRNLEDGIDLIDEGASDDQIAARSRPGTRAKAYAKAKGATTLVIACGALAKEVLDIRERLGLDTLALTCLPANLHNRPQDIPDAVRAAIHKHRDDYEHILIGFGDCGTGGLLDKVLEEEGVERIAGPHCYAFYEGNALFAEKADDDFSSFYLTDFLVRQFDAMIIRPLGLDRFPQLRDTYFQHYEKLVYLAQSDDECLNARAYEAAKRLDLPLEIRRTGYGDMESFLNRPFAKAF